MSVSRSLMVLMPALRKLDTVMPARMMVVRELSAAYASPKMVSVVSRAPAKAAAGIQYEAPPNISVSITAKPAPELTPMVFGLARELFMTLCKSTPAVASPMPARTAPMTRGRRTVFTKI